MPYVNIKLTADEEAPTREQKRALIEGVTRLIGEVMHKSTAHLVVVIDEVPMDNWGIDGKTVRERRAQQPTK